MSWIFITLILTVVTGGCCNDTAGCDSSPDVLTSSADTPVFALVPPPSGPATIHGVLSQADLTLNRFAVYVFTAQPKFEPLLRSRSIRSRFSGTSPPVV